MRINKYICDDCIYKNLVAAIYVAILKITSYALTIGFTHFDAFRILPPNPTGPKCVGVSGVGSFKMCSW
jgi:hypothetical protein